MPGRRALALMLLAETRGWPALFAALVVTGALKRPLLRLLALAGLLLRLFLFPYGAFAGRCVALGRFLPLAARGVVALFTGSAFPGRPALGALLFGYLSVLLHRRGRLNALNLFSGLGFSGGTRRPLPVF